MRMSPATTNRLAMYNLVYAFELDLRQMIRRFLDYEGNPTNILSSDEYATAQARLTTDPDSGDVYDCLDLRPTYDLLNRHRDLLPAGLARELRQFTANLDVIVPIRNRLMHARPLKVGDQDALKTALAPFKEIHWQQLHATWKILAGNDWMSRVKPLPEPDDRILNNLPLPDYDETGLMGRDEETAKLSSLLQRGRDSVVTVTGEGGIGKTALALAAAYACLDDESSPFEVILWVSLKREALTARGVEQIRHAFSDLTGATEAAVQTLDEDFSGSIEKAAEALKGLDVLLCIDNLESVSGDDFVQLYETLPDSVRYLVTSRQGIGQIERRFPLGPLSTLDATKLLDVFAKSRDVHSLISITWQAKQSIVKELRHSPLGIKWLVLATAAGRPPVELVKSQDELLTFCVKSVFDSLSPNARTLLLALWIMGRPAALGELVIVTELEPEDAQVSVQDLTQGSLVTARLVEEGELETHLQLTETARRYLEFVVDNSDPFLYKMSQNFKTYRESEERRMRDAGSRSLHPAVLRPRSAADGPASNILRAALLASSKGSLDEALKDVDRAKRLSPDFWEVYRVEAFILSSSNQPRAGNATSLYQKALELAPNEEARAIVAHFYSGHLLRSDHDIDASLEMARLAHEGIGTDESKMALGNALVRAHDYGAGITMLREASCGLEGKAHLVAMTALISGLRRWAEYATNESNFKLAEELLSEGLSTVKRMHEEGNFDRRFLLVALDLINEVARLHRSAGVFRIDVDFDTDVLAYFAEKIVCLASPAKLSQLARMRGTFSQMGKGGALIAQVLPGVSDESQVEVDSHGTTGVIVTCQENYAFARVDELDENVFFHRGQCANFDFVAVGVEVVFSAIDFDDQERLRGTGVRVVLG